ncbi:DUF429 domain-containing protein [candidate division KSB1 bacterium]|nr:DUF429 domain-containing protein [candidate division KSB1 bacterium]
MQEKNIGLAFGEWNGEVIRILEILTRPERENLIETLVSWCTGDCPTLLALDAPLGWPAALGQYLAQHQAGDPLAIDPNLLFRRETDRVIRQEAGKQSLDVGADRIARTALAALDLIQSLRISLKKPIALLFEPPQCNEIGAIEVYPAATLKLYGLQRIGYKKVDARSVRREIIDDLRKIMKLPVDQNLLEDDVDTLDAVLCVLAGVDFLKGEVVFPKDMALARKEGWTWIRDPKLGMN